MKKILSAILICTLALSLAGCGQRQTPDGSQTEYNSENNEAAESLRNIHWKIPRRRSGRRKFPRILSS